MLKIVKVFWTSENPFESDEIDMADEANPLITNVSSEEEEIFSQSTTRTNKF